MTLVLASQSPRRRELMHLVAPDFLVDSADVDERVLDGESPADLALRLARDKAAAVRAKRGGEDEAVIGCDTVVELDGNILGKPENRDEAIRMLTALSGRDHFVHTGLCLLDPGGSHTGLYETTRVTFSAIPPGEIERVADTPEPYDKAGAYGIQGWAARFIPAIEGCYYNVMGLPVAALWQLLQHNIFDKR